METLFSFCCSFTCTSCAFSLVHHLFTNLTSNSPQVFAAHYFVLSETKSTVMQAIIMSSLIPSFYLPGTPFVFAVPLCEMAVPSHYCRRIMKDVYHIDEQNFATYV